MARTIGKNNYISRTLNILPLERKIRMFQLTCNVALHIDILITAFLTIFRKFPTTIRIFLKIFQNCSKGELLTLSRVGRIRHVTLPPWGLKLRTLSVPTNLWDSRGFCNYLNNRLIHSEHCSVQRYKRCLFNSS